jgi:hypothetical protein
VALPNGATAISETTSRLKVTRHLEITITGSHHA